MTAPGPSELARRIAPIQMWMIEAGHKIIHGNQAHSDWDDARPAHLPEQACEWVAMTISDFAPDYVTAIPAETLDQAIEAMHAAMLELLQSSDRRHFEVATQLRVALDALQAAKSEGGGAASHERDGYLWEPSHAECRCCR